MMATSIIIIMTIQMIQTTMMVTRTITVINDYKYYNCHKVKIVVEVIITIILMRALKTIVVIKSRITTKGQGSD